MRLLWFQNGPGIALGYLKGGKPARSWTSWLAGKLREEYELHIAFIYPKYHEPFDYEGIRFHPICEKHWKRAMLLGRLPGGGIPDRRIRERCLDLIGEVQPDLVHIHGTENPYITLLGHTEVPVAVSIQGVVTVIRHKYLAGFGRSYLGASNRSLLHPVSLLTEHSFRHGLRELGRMARREEECLARCRYVIGRTDWDRRVASILAPDAAYFGHDDRILAAPYYEARWQMPQEGVPPVIHTTLTNSYYKGFETLCRALMLLRRAGTEVRAQVAGLTTTDSVYRITRRMMGREFPAGQLDMLGSVAAAANVEHMRRAGIYVLPSHIDNNSNSLCEAMMLGMPCIASFVGGIGSVLHDGRDGLAVQDGDPWALAGAVKELLANPAEALRLADAARETAVERHRPETIIRNLTRIYRSIVHE